MRKRGSPQSPGGPEEMRETAVEAPTPGDSEEIRESAGEVRYPDHTPLANVTKRNLGKHLCVV